MKVLIAYDGSAHADAAIQDLCRAGLPPQTEAIVASVAHDGWPHPKESQNQKGPFAGPWRATLKEAAAMADAVRSRLQSEHPDWTVSSEPLFGDPAKTLLKTIDVTKTNLVVVGSHGHSVPARLLLGSVSTELIHRAHCSVRVVRQSVKTQGPVRILVAVDGSDEAEACVDAVARRSWPSGAEARVIAVQQTLVAKVPEMASVIQAGALAAERAYRVIEASDRRERVELSFVASAAAGRLRNAGLAADSVVIDGDPRKEINAEADRWRADCVFVGARGIGALDRLLLGSVSGAVVAHAHRAVEVVRH